MAPPFGRSPKVMPLCQSGLEQSHPSINLVIVTEDDTKFRAHARKAQQHFKSTQLYINKAHDLDIHRLDRGYDHEIDLILIDYQSEHDIHYMFDSLCKLNQNLPLIVGIEPATNNRLKDDLKQTIGLAKLNSNFVSADSNVNNAWGVLKWEGYLSKIKSKPSLPNLDSSYLADQDSSDSYNTASTNTSRTEDSKQSLKTQPSQSCCGIFCSTKNSILTTNECNEFDSLNMKNNNT